jgi:hypothetical protein
VVARCLCTLQRHPLHRLTSPCPPLFPTLSCCLGVSARGVEGRRPRCERPVLRQQVGHLAQVLRWGTVRCPLWRMSACARWRTSAGYELGLKHSALLPRVHPHLQCLRVHASAEARMDPPAPLLRMHAVTPCPRDVEPRLPGTTSRPLAPPCAPPPPQRPAPTPASTWCPARAATCRPTAGGCPA